MYKSEADIAVDLEMQSDMMFILSALCEHDIHRKVGTNFFLEKANGSQQKSVPVNSALLKYPSSVLTFLHACVALPYPPF